ncbi:hypothetical protein [Pacificibacter sp. AS14]
MTQTKHLNLGNLSVETAGTSCFLIGSADGTLPPFKLARLLHSEFR